MSYDKYEFGRHEKYIAIFKGAGLAFILLMLFYKNIYIAFAGCIPGAILYTVYYKNEMKRKCKWQLTIQFKDALESLVSAMSAGYSMEHAITEARKDLSYMYRQEDMIMKELVAMEKGISLRIPMEQLWIEFGERSQVEDIRTFGEIYKIARRSGGHLLQIMKRTSKGISEKIEIEREIETMITGKRLEMKCMTAIPLFIILYLQVASPGFLDPLYGNLFGILFMSGALLIYLGSYFLAHRIVRINF